MKRLRRLSPGRLAGALVLAMLAVSAASAGARPLQLSHSSRTEASVRATSFTFSTPQELTGHPPSELFFQQDAEPEIKTDISGNIYVTAIQGVPGGVDLWKSTDAGTTFSYMGQPDGAQDHCGAPPLPQCGGVGGGDDSIDVSSGGYLYVSSLWLGSVTMSTSMDGGTGGTLPGQAWQVQPVSTTVPVDDREWVAAYGPQTVYMTMRQAPGTGDLFAFKSTDAGKTFTPTTATPITGIVSREGNLVVDPYNGNLYTTYIPNPAASQKDIHLLASTDGGATWTDTTAYTGAANTSPANAFPILALDRGGNLYLVFTDCTLPATARTNCHVFLTATANPSAAAPTWTTPVQVDSGAGNASTVMPWVVAGSPGIVDITWMGSTMTSPDNTPSSQSEWWNVFFAQTRNALSGTPTFDQTIVASRVHNLPICSRGGSCTTSPTATSTRKLLEYYTMTLDPDGNANIAFPDSVDNCPVTTCISNTWYVKQTAGLSAYAPPAPPAAATFSAPNVNVGSPGGEPGTRVDSHNCIYITTPRGLGLRSGGALWKSTDNGATFTSLPNPVADETVNLTGGDEDILPFAKADGSRPDPLYFADLGATTVHIRKSTDGGASWAKPGPGGAAGDAEASSDRQWLAADRNGNDQTVYLMDHEAASEAIRFAALTNDTVWSPSALGSTAPELIVPPSSTLPNTNPGPIVVNRTTHTVYGFFAASSTTTNAMDPPFGKMMNLWDAAGAGTFTSGAPPGPFSNFPVFKGLFDSPDTNPATGFPPAAARTYGQHLGNLFPSGAIDAAGNVYAVWTTNSTRANTVQANNTPSTTFDVWFAASHDGGHNFYGPFRVSSGVGTSVQPWIAAADNGRVDIVWYQTNTVAPPIVSDRASPGTLTGGSNNIAASAVWNVMFAQSLNASSREPVFTVTQASDNPNHRGPISIGGLTGNADRSLADFFQVAIGPDGLANIGYADNANASGAEPTHVSFTRQTSGPLALTNPTVTGCLSNPTAVTVTRFAAHAAGRVVRVNWQTATETGVAGYNVWRATPYTRWQKLNKKLVAADATGLFGGRYEYLDRTARRGVPYSYKLEVVRTDGRRAWTAPVPARR